MKPRRHSRRPARRPLLVPALVMLILFGTLAVKMWPRNVPLARCSRAYQTYACCPGINASFIEDYTISDSVTVPVTLLCAATDSAWAILQKDYNLHDPLPDLDPDMRELFSRNKKMVWCQKIPKDSRFQTLPADTALSDLLAVSFFNRTIAIFHVKNREEQCAVLFYNIDQYITPEDK